MEYVLPLRSSMTRSQEKTRLEDPVVQVCLFYCMLHMIRQFIHSLPLQQSPSCLPLRLSKLKGFGVVAVMATPAKRWGLGKWGFSSFTCMDLPQILEFTQDPSGNFLHSSMENGHRNSGRIHPFNIMIFHSFLFVVCVFETSTIEANCDTTEHLGPEHVSKLSVRVPENGWWIEHDNHLVMTHMAIENPL